ncbi:MAG: hypothetical protein K2K84_04020, partial [Muribaculaceae bacterium]|nr:hypothetical protein [Muribaculaceae bacterium]
MMLNKTNPFARIGFFILVSSVLLNSCSNYENPINSVSQGKFDIKYTIDMSVSDISGELYTLPDSLTDVLPVKLTITDLASNMEHVWTDISEFTTMNSFRPGEYRVELEALSSTREFGFSADTVISVTGIRPAQVRLTLKPDVVWISNDFECDSPYTLHSIIYHSLKNGATDTVTTNRRE